MQSFLKKNFKPAVFAAMTLFLSACNGFFEKDNTPPPMPLAPYQVEVRPALVWSTNTGSGTNGEYLKTSPAIDETALYVASLKGTVTAVNRVNGRILWHTNTSLSLAGGPGVSNGIVVVGGRKGQVVALQASNGRILWQTTVAGEILAKPALQDGTAVIKTVDGQVRALSLKNGEELWSFKQNEPSLILRGASAPLIRHRDVLAGFANGNLAKLSLSDGRLYWMQPIAFPEGAFAIERMIDIDANPIVFDHRIYAATYQGKISSLDWSTGRILWSHDISSFTGMQADSNAVYISDAKSHVWAFTADSGLVAWRQNKLDSRVVSGPAVMGRYVVVGDAEGYLHWLDKKDGHIAGRVAVSGGVYAAPIAEGNVVYVFTSKGQLLTYEIA